MPPSPHPRCGVHPARNRRLSTTPTAAYAAYATPAVAGAIVRATAIAAVTVTSLTAAVLAAAAAARIAITRGCLYSHSGPPPPPPTATTAAGDVSPAAPDLAVSRSAVPSVSGVLRGQLGRVVGPSGARPSGKRVKPPTNVPLTPSTGTLGGRDMCSDSSHTTGNLPMRVARPYIEIRKMVIFG